MSDAILKARGLSKDFRGFAAVTDVNLTVQRGSIHALIGPNGAGKTTVFNLLSRFLPASRGEIIFDGSVITHKRSIDVALRGMIRSFQISAVFPQLTVLENVRVGLQRKLNTAYQFWRSERMLFQLNERAFELLTQVGLEAHADELTASLPYGRKRALEIATTLAMEPKLMFLDEPTQGMGHEDVEQVTELIKTVSAGRTVLMVEHNMKVVSGIADRISVLQHGQVLTEGTYHEVSRDPSVIEAYMGSVETEATGL